MSNEKVLPVVQSDTLLQPVPKAKLTKGYRTIRYILYFLYATLPLGIMGYLLVVYFQGADDFDGLYVPDFPSSGTASSITGQYDDLNVEYHDLRNYRPTAEGWNNNERVLFLVPLRDASQHLPMFFSHMRNLTYPHNLVDLAFLISDTSDSTIPDLKRLMREIQNDPNPDNHFGRINIYEKDFGQVIGQSFSDRHGFKAQGPRRKLMAIARNWLLTTALRPDHSWVYWRDADVETIPPTIIEDLMHHDKDVIVPNVWRPLPDWLGSQQPYDLNSWQESEGGIELADRLDEDAVIVEGYAEYATWRPHLAYLRDPLGDPEIEMELEGIGGVSILSKADVFKSGAMFPAFSYQKHAETEAFGKLCKTMQFSVVGLPHYTIWHIYEPSSDDLKHMEWMAEEEKRRAIQEKNKVIYDKQWKAAFDDVETDWSNLKFNVFKNTDSSRYRSVSVDWTDVDEYLIEVDDDIAESNINDNIMNHNKEFEKSMLLRMSNRQSKFGESKGEETFGEFPLYKYGHRGPKNYKFVKFNNPLSNAFSNLIDSDVGDDVDPHVVEDLRSEGLKGDEVKSGAVAEIAENTAENGVESASENEGNEEKSSAHIEAGPKSSEREISDPLAKAIDDILDMTDSTSGDESGKFEVPV